MINIRPATREDDDAVWRIFHAVIAGGDAFYFDPQMSREEALAFWFAAGAHAYIAESNAEILGAYTLMPNKPGLGNHVANAAYMVSPAARGRGIGRLLGEHSLGEARRLGFVAMQFNFVVSTNEAAVKLWKQLGFHIAGTLPRAFRHAKLGFVDAYVMFRSLDDAA